MASLKDLIVLGPARFLDKIYGNLEGNATSANKLSTARTISLSGAVKGSATFDGSGNVGIATTFAQGMNYAGSSSDGGAANSALKLVNSSNTGLSIGSATEPVYFSNGVPVKANTIENAKSAEYLSPGANINGTLFTGKDDITTTTWGVAQTITIGNTGKSVNGSKGYTWSLAEIGALPTAGGTITGKVYVNTASGTNPFYITRNGGASESTAFWQDDSKLHLDVTNDETTAGIDFKLSATDTENSDGSKANTGTISFSVASGVTTITANKFTGSAATLTTSRAFRISDTANSSSTASFNGSADATLYIPTTIKGFNDIQTKKLTITDTTATSHIAFSRGSWNYITAPASGTIAFSPNGRATTAAGAVAAIDSSGIIPGNSNNTFNLGSSSYKWKNVYATTFTGALSGNATTATTLYTGRAINGTTFDGSKDITTSTWGTARTVTISDNSGTNTQANTNINGGDNFTLKMPATIKAALTGNASSASLFYSKTENSTTYVSRFIPFFDDASDGNKSALHNSGLVYDYKAGTTTTTGEAYLRIGTSSTSVTANNMRGNILFYGTSSGYTRLLVLNNTEKNTTLYMPNPGDGASGTLAWTTYNTATGSSSKPVYIASTGKATAISNVALGSSTAVDNRMFSTVRKSSADASYGKVELHVSSAADGALIRFLHTNTSGTETSKYVKLSTTAFYSTVNNDLTLGTSSYKWKSAYATTFYGALNGQITRLFTSDTSNAINLLKIYDTDGTTEHMMIGAHNTGNTVGAMYLIPYPRTKDAWAGEEGLYISKNLLKLDNNRVPTTGNTTGTVGSTSKAVYVNAGVITEITTLAVSKGGTGTSTAPVQGGVIYASSTSAYASTAAGSSGQLLQSAGTGKPTWITATNSNTASTVVKRDSSGNFSAGTITANLTGTASKVNIAATNPSTGTTYMIPFMAGTGSQSLLGNDGIGYWTNEGTTTATGTGELKLGNNKASGTAGNKKGYIYMYGTSSGYTEIIPSNNTTSNIQVYLPSSGGTIALTSSNITGSSASCTGNAATATKLATARSIALSGDFTGSASFNGTANATITASNYYSTVGGNNTNTYPYRRIAYISGITGTHNDRDCILDIRHTYNGGGFGRVKISYRTNASGAATAASATWLYKYNIADDAIIVATYGVTGNSCYADVFYKTTGGWPRCKVYQVYGDRAWTLVSSTEATDAASKTEAYESISAAATALHSGTAYTDTVESTQANSVGILPISGGGTGASTPAAALGNLGGVGYTVVTNLSSLL